MLQQHKQVLSAANSARGIKTAKHSKRNSKRGDDVEADVQSQATSSNKQKSLNAKAIVTDNSESKPLRKVRSKDRIPKYHQFAMQ